MLKKLIFCLVLIFAFTTAQAQTKYWVFFEDKAADAAKNFDPYIYFQKNALERRQKANLPFFDYTDLPVNENYINAVKLLADSLGHESRWFNAIGVWASEENIRKIEALPFVKNVRKMSAEMRAASTTTETQVTLPLSDTTLRRLQLQSMQGKFFQEENITGKGVRIAVFDVGFRGANVHPAFEHLRRNKQILLTQDFIKNDTFVYDYGTHGTMVLSCIAGMYLDSFPMGLATDAEFLLARTERDLTEWKDEEDNWIAAMEWADKNGAQIISSSLGYTYKRYFYRDMNGETSLIAKAANMAAHKGMLVITAAGNDGTSGWKYICTPGDADSALTIGGINPQTGYHISFSSYGPAADETLKPNVSAPGQAFVADSKDYSQAYGTSFATPLTAGFAACVWQMNPKLTNMQVFHEIENSATLYPYYDYAHGYGVPQAGYFLLQKKGFKIVTEKSFTISQDDDNIKVKLDDRFFNNESVHAQLKEAKLYYHIAKPNGVVLKYYVIQPEQQDVLNIPKEDLPVEGILRVHFMGYTEEFNY